MPQQGKHRLALPPKKRERGCRRQKRQKKTPSRLRGRFRFGAGNETRTRDPDLGKVVLYQLSYSRKYEANRYLA